jgi:hypothetical protein
MNKYDAKSAARSSLLTFARMRLSSAAPALATAGALAWGCTVYDTDLVPASGAASSAGASATGGASGNPSHLGGSTGSAGKSDSAGTTSEGGKSGTASGGTMPAADGGVGNDGGEPASSGGGGSSSGGAAGKGGSGGGSSGSGGNGGSGGMPAGAKCADHPITLKTTWVPTASRFSNGDGMETDTLYNPPKHMTDGSFTERWSSGTKQVGDEWIEVDFGALVNLTTVTLNVNTDTGDYPRMYEMRFSSTKAQDFAAAIRTSGAGAPGNSVFTFPQPITGRYLLISQTGMAENTAWWTIAELLVTCTDP